MENIISCLARRVNKQENSSILERIKEMRREKGKRRKRMRGKATLHFPHIVWEVYASFYARQAARNSLLRCTHFDSASILLSDIMSWWFRILQGKVVWIFNLPKGAQGLKNYQTKTVSLLRAYSKIYLFHENLYSIKLAMHILLKSSIL